MTSKELLELEENIAKYKSFVLVHNELREFVSKISDSMYVDMGKGHIAVPLDVIKSELEVAINKFVL